MTQVGFHKIWYPPYQTVLEDQKESKTTQNPKFYRIFGVFHDFKVFSQIEIEFSSNDYDYLKH